MALLDRLRPAGARPDDDALDSAIARVQLGLDAKRERWMLFLARKRDRHRAQAQDDADLEADDAPGPAPTSAERDSPPGAPAAADGPA